jgi:hypothetical protein
VCVHRVLKDRRQMESNFHFEYFTEADATPLATSFSYKSRTVVTCRGCNVNTRLNGLYNGCTFINEPLRHLSWPMLKRREGHSVCKSPTK